jgi:hypothetical protein
VLRRKATLSKRAEALSISALTKVECDAFRFVIGRPGWWSEKSETSHLSNTSDACSELAAMLTR